MLSQIHARRAAAELVNRFGEVAIAAAMLRSQEAQALGHFTEMTNWRRIAAAAAHRCEMA